MVIINTDDYVSRRDDRRHDDCRDDRRHEDKARDRYKDKFDFNKENCQIVIFAEKVIINCGEEECHR